MKSAPPRELAVDGPGGAVLGQASELSDAQEIAARVAATLKAHRVHGARSVTAVTSVERLHRRLLQFFSDHSLLSVAFSVLPDALCYKGHPVLALDSTSDPVFNAMVSSGLRQFAFRDALSQ